MKTLEKTLKLQVYVFIGLSECACGACVRVEKLGVLLSSESRLIEV